MPAKPRILERHLAAQTAVFKVERLDLEFSNGVRRRYERILGAGEGSVLIVPLRDEATLLLVREYAAGSDRYELAFPKGIVEAGEDILAAADREMQEEIGYGARDLSLLRTVSLAPGYIQHHTHIVLARELYPRRAQGDEPEPIEVVPWRLDAVDGLLAHEEFSEARSLAALFLTRRFLGKPEGV